MAEEKVHAELARQGYTRVEQAGDNALRVTQDRLQLDAKHRDRLTESVEAALHAGRGRVSIFPVGNDRHPTAGSWIMRRVLRTAAMTVRNETG